MIRETYVMRNGKLIPKRLAGPRIEGRAAPHVISDSLPDMIHPATGKRMDSKSAFRAVTRAHGCVEVGNETQVDRRRVEMPNLKSDIARAIQELGG